MKESDKELVGHLMWVGQHVAEKEGLGESGYRCVVNNGKHGGNVQ